MPELPEVETICRALSKQIVNHKIIKVNRLTNLKLRKAIPQNLQEINDSSITQISRRSKYILIHLDNNKILIIHLGMSGKILIKDDKYIIQKHDHVELILDDKSKIIYNDPRRFGLIYLSDIENIKNIELFKDLGIEPLEDQFTDDYFNAILKNKKQAIKLAIMNPKIIVGVGNIYACESLFTSKISPERSANSLTKNEISTLRKNIIKILKNSIDNGGSSLKDYKNINGEKGFFQNSFFVYGRNGKECFICNEAIEKLKQAGRTSFYCPNCQK